MPRPSYPCTGPTVTDGFAEFLRAELGAPRANLQRLTAELRRLLGARHLVLVNSGSSANLVAAHLLASKVAKPGRPVAAVGAFTFATTVSALLHAGFEVVVVDVDPGSFALSPAALKRLRKHETFDVVVPTHFLGYPADIGALRQLADDRGAILLQDACETFDLSVGGRSMANWGDVVTWSFYHPHHLSTFGGGAVAVDDRDAAVVESLVHWGRACLCHTTTLSCPRAPGPNHQFHYERLGFNLEMSELNACFGRFALQRHDADEARRQRHFATLTEHLGPHAATGAITLWPPITPSPFVFPIMMSSPRHCRDVTGRLRALGVETRSLMGGVVTDQPAFQQLETDGLHHAREIAARSFFVGVHQTLAPDAVATVARLVSQVIGSV